ncbi:MAG: hypothetical protein M3Z54_15225 [Gemmatimonadota bacterium]|nr:hypothetical protein [Gemmatimonadota bacterium]
MSDWVVIIVLIIILVLLLNERKEIPPDGLYAPGPDLEALTGEGYIPDRSEGSVASQRDKMRELYQGCAGDFDKTIAAYAAAERRGEVHRRSNDYALNPEEYARRLLADGVRKGWLK